MSFREQQHAREELCRRGLLEERYVRLKHRFYLRVNLEAYNILVERMATLVETGGLEDQGEDPERTNGDLPKLQNVTSGSDETAPPDAPTPHVVVSAESTAEIISNTGEATASPRSEPSAAEAADAPPAKIPLPAPPTARKRTSKARRLMSGQLDPDLIALIQSMTCAAFHCLAESNKLVEDFWDAQIDLINAVGLVGLPYIIRECDAWYAANRHKWPLGLDGAMRRMQYSIKMQLEQAQRRAQRRRPYA